MARLLTLAFVAVFIGACSSGGGCDGGGEQKSSGGQAASLPGGSSPHSGTNEMVSFQGLGKKAGGETAPGQTAAAASALGGNGGPAPAPADPVQTVICGGFPNLAADCKTDPAFEAVVKKCCPAGTVDQCQAIPGGARLMGHRCTAPAASAAK